MSNDRFGFDLPEKVQGGFIVRLYFKTFNGALDWLQEQGLIGSNSAQKIVDDWEQDQRKIIDRESKSLRKRITTWLSGNKQ
jgi:hypothetical protein